MDFIFIFFIIFGYKINVFDFSVIVPFLLLLVASIKNNDLLISKDILIIECLFLFLFVIGSVSYVYNVTDFEFEYLLKPIRLILLSVIIYFYFFKKNIQLIDVIKYITIASLVNSLVIYSQYILDFLDVTKNFLIHPVIGTYTPYRKPGLCTGFPTSGLVSVIGSLLSVFLMFLYRSKYWFIVFCIITSTVLLSARSAMYIYILIVPVYLMYISIYYKNYIYLKLYFIIIICIILLIYYNIGPLLQGTIDKMFANIINYYDTGDFNDYSTKHLLSSDHYSLPIQFDNLIIGTSLGKSSGFQPSDVSFIRIIWSNGLLSLFIYLTAFFSFLFLSYQKVKFFNHKPLSVLLFCLYLSVFILMFKGPYLFSRIIGDSLLLFSLAIIINSNKGKSL